MGNLTDTTAVNLTATYSNLMPSGAIMMWATTTAPDAGWLICNGASVDRVGTYAALFGIIGTTYGSVDADHFNLPDLRQKFAMGAVLFEPTSTDWTSPGTISDSQFTNPDNMKVEDGTYATYTGAGNYSKILGSFTNFNFNIPSNAIITGIACRVVGKHSHNSLDGLAMPFYNNPEIIGDAPGDHSSISTQLPVTDTAITMGGIDDLWNATLTYETINKSNFGVKLKPYVPTNGTSCTTYIDVVQLKVYYSTKYPLAATGGSVNHTHDTASHSHTMNNHTHTLNNHTHTMNNHTHTLTHTHTDTSNHTHTMDHNHSFEHSHSCTTGGPSSNGTRATWFADTTGAEQNHTHTIVIQHTNASTSTTVVNTGGSAVSFGSTAINVAANNSATSGPNTGSGSNNIASSNTTETVGVNNPPYLVINYIIKV